MNRTYDMRNRLEAAEKRRAGIVAAAHELLDRPEGAQLTVQEVADAAGVSRATVYNRVGSRPELLQAVLVDQGRLIGFDRVLAAMALEEPRRRVVETVRESCRAWGTRPNEIRNTLALAATDREVRRFVQRYELDRRRRLADLVDSVLDATGRERAVYGAAAQAALTLVTSFPAYDHLTLDASHEAAMEQLTGIALSSFGMDPRRPTE